MNLADLLKKSESDDALSKEELVFLLGFPTDSLAVYRIMGQASRISKKVADNKAEVHAQFSLNLSPCECECKFCSFASVNKIFDKNFEISPEEAVENARILEDEGANAIFVMTTANYAFDKFLEISQEVRRNLKNETVLIANVGDKTYSQAKKIKDSGYQGVYHAIRLREGIDTGLDPERRKKSIRSFQEAGLKVGTCVEPVGPEHTNEELAEMILFTASFRPAYSGAARRITIPGGSLEKYGMISELRMAHIVAVTRLGMPHEVKGNCTHEPCTLGAIAGANLFWAEKGANPRDVREETEEGRGGTIEHCKKLFKESDWEVLKGASHYYGHLY